MGGGWRIPSESPGNFVFWYFVFSDSEAGFECVRVGLRAETGIIMQMGFCENQNR